MSERRAEPRDAYFGISPGSGYKDVERAMKKLADREEYAAISKCLKSARKAAKITQQLLAARLSKPQSFVSKYERGGRNLDVVEFLRIVCALGADPRAIVDEILKVAPSLRVRVRRRPRAR